MDLKNLCHPDFETPIFTKRAKSVAVSVVMRASDANVVKVSRDFGAVAAAVR